MCSTQPALRVVAFRLAALVFLSAAAITSSHAQRLPATVVPRHYALTLTPDLKSATFTGVETIDVVLKNPSKTIVLNSADIAFQCVTISAAGKRQTARVSLDPAKQQATLTVGQPIPAGKATLNIRYSGILNSKLRGFYLSKTARRNYAVTQFESTDARRGFPSFDEPAFKATFDIALVVDKDDTAISNGPVVSDTPGPAADQHILTFLTTPKMSTYLVAFLVGDFQCTSGEQDGVTIRSCATPDKVALTPYSIQVAKFALHYYNTYFGIPYPLKKLDLIAIPDFEAGAMENFGAITYRESALLIDDKTASLDSKKLVAVDITHEMAHQWFGDLVTMQWWDNVWLNEGFATWMENKSVAAMHPEWDMAQSVVVDREKTLNIDAQPTTRPIRAKAETPDEIDQMFDGIAYGKASDVLLTVENYVGPETFRTGIHNYLAAHLYGNATAEDFWNAETDASQKPVDRIMDSLVTQPGVPLLTFGEPTGGKVPVAQKRFFVLGNGKQNNSERWTLPVCFKTSGSEQNCEVLTPETTDLNIPKDSLFFANASGNGYYRSAYTATAYSDLVKNVESRLSPEERISLLGDEWAQFLVGKASAGDYLNLVAAVKGDSNAQVLASAIEGVGQIYTRVAATPQEREGVAAWVRKNFAPEYAKLAPPSDSDSANTRVLRAQLFKVLGLYGQDPLILAQAQKIARQYMADPASVEPTLRQTALTVAARHGDAHLFDQLLNLYETSSNPEFQSSALRRLAEFQNPSLVDRALNLAVSGAVRNQDAAEQFAESLKIDENRAQTWRFIQTHWDQVRAQFTIDMGARLVAGTEAFCSPAGRDSVEKFFSTHKVAAADVSLRHAVEAINGCIELRSSQEPQLKSWLAAQSD